MDINIKLENFEGPFDLLYHLIEKNKINIYDIPISDLTEQYLEYIEKANNINLNSMSEFLVMASTLIEIKSKMLLPTPTAQNEIQQDPRNELVNKLIEFKKFKIISDRLNEIQDESTKKLFKKQPTDLKQIKSNKAELDITFEQIYSAFEQIVKQKQDRTDKIRSKFNSIEKDLYTIEQKKEYILNLLKSQSQINFKKIFKNDTEKLEVIITFLALLELIKIKKIDIYQNQIFSDIIIKKRDLNDR